MGSCCSRNTGEHDAARTTTTETTQIRSANTTSASTTARRSSAPIQGNFSEESVSDKCLGNRPFKPRRDGTWTSPVPITRSMLHRQRTEFWETAPQYDGLVETWNSLRVAVELSHQNDLPTAQAVLDSAGITIPTEISVWDVMMN